MISTPERIVQRLREASRYWLFLDYDGTLADFAPTPDDIIVDQALIKLVTELAAHQAVRVAVISGRRLEHIARLVPVPGITLAGTYGIEIKMMDGSRINRLDANTIRPRLLTIQSRWRAILNQKPGFYLEDKFWSLAIHAKEAENEIAEQTIRAARASCEESLIGTHEFQMLGGHKFLEVAPLIANKGKTIEYLLQEIPFPGAELICIGDDDKDEQAFEVIKSHGGIAIQVSNQQRPTNADFRLHNPAEARSWLTEFKKLINKFYSD
jgi:trehalose 6-phosphate phosphatase